MRDWSNGPHLVRADNGKLLRASELAVGGDARHYVAWDEATQRPIAYDPVTGRYDGLSKHLALTGEYLVTGVNDMVACRPVFDHYSELCRSWSPELVEATCWIPQGQLEETARTIWHARPVSYYAWSGHEHHANTTQTARAMALLYALTGNFDAPGGLWIAGVSPHGPWLLSIEHSGVAAEISTLPISPVVGPGLATFELPTLSQLHTAIDRVYKLSVSLPVTAFNRALPRRAIRGYSRS